LAAIFLWSATFGIARSLSERVGGLTAGASVYLVGGAFSLISLGWKWRRAGCIKLPSARYLLGCGFLFVFYTTVIYLAVGMSKDRLQLMEVALLNYLWPTLTILLSIPLLGTRPNFALLPGTLMALVGLVLVMTHSEITKFFHARLLFGTAHALALAGAVAWGMYSNLARRWAEPGVTGAVELFVPITGLVLLVVSLFGERAARHWELHAGIEALAMGGITFLAYCMWDAAMRRGNLLVVVACSYFTPLLSSLVSCIYLGVAPGGNLWIGCLLLIAGSLLSRRGVKEVGDGMEEADERERPDASIGSRGRS
jgi:drug/metabolite transporter (DMT)-like permease